MRDLVSCFSEHSVSVADTSCSSYGATGCTAPSVSPSVLNAVTNLYKITLSTQKQMMISVTWSRSQMSQALGISFRDTTLSSFKLNVNSRLFRKTKGSKVIESGNWKFEVFWDLSTARYKSTSPEPIDGYYVLVTINSELGLVLGNLATEVTYNQIKNISCTVSKALLVSRKEQCSGSTMYATKAKFCNAGAQHDILIRCSGDEEGLKYPTLSVSIDKRIVINVNRLQWNFRGNQSIIVDGLLIDLMWDVHGWLFFGPSPGQAVFMFRTRRGFDNRLWLEEKMLQKGQENVEFSLLIHASKN